MSDGVPETLAELEEEVQGLNESELGFLRKKGENDLLYLSKGILGYKDVNRQTHGALCRFMQDDSCDRRMELMPRGHLKTTICSIADSIRRGVKDPDNARILIANETYDNSVLILTEIRGHFERNKLVRLLWPGVVPGRFSGPGIIWSGDAANLVRKTSYKEPTFSAIGVGGAAVSRHFTNIKADDLIGLEAYKSEPKMKRAMDWTDNLEGLQISEHETIYDFTGTRWKKRDLYWHIMRTYGSRMRVFRREIVEIDKDGKEYFIFPAHFSEKTLKVIKKNPLVYYAQYLNNPLSEEAQDFDERNLQYYEVTNNGEYLLGSRKYSRSDLDIVVLVDPNGGSPTAPDEAAITVTGNTPHEDVVVLESYGARPDPTEFTNQLWRIAMKWRPRVIGIEEAGQQNTMHYFGKRMKKEGIFFRTQPLKHKNQEKFQRIRTAVAPLLGNRKFWVARTMTALISQVSDFPDLENDDRIDTLGYGPQVWRTPQTQEAHDRAEAAAAKILAARDQVTGY